MSEIEDLKKVGLTEYQAKAYVALIRFGTQTGRGISKKSGVPPTRVFDVLRGLINRGLVTMIEEKPMVFKPVKPEIGLISLFEKNTKEMKSLHSVALESLKTIKKIKQPINNSIEKISIYSGFDNLWGLIKNSFKTSKKCLKLMFTYERRPYSVIRLMHKAVKRSVDLKIITTKISDKGMEWMKEDIKHGIKIRYYPVEEIRICIKDKKESLITMINPKELNDRITVHIKSKELSKALDGYFDSLWKKAKPIKFFLKSK